MCYQKSQKKSEFSELQLRYHVQATHTIRSCSVRNHMVLNAEGASSLLNSKSNAWVWTPRRQFLPLTLLRCWCFKIDTFFETIYVFFWQGSGGPIVFGIISSDVFACNASGEIFPNRIGPPIPCQKYIYSLRKKCQFWSISISTERAVGTDL